MRSGLTPTARAIPRTGTGCRQATGFRLRPPAPLVAGLLLVVLTPAAANAQGISQGQLIDRIVAIVDGEVITLGQLRRAVALVASDFGAHLAACREPGNATGAAEADAIEQRALDCMIDGLLMFQHVRRFPQFGVRREDVDVEYARVVGTFPSRQAFDEELRRRGLSPGEVHYDLERQLLVDNYIRLRYRDVVDVRSDELRRYYDEVLAPEMERQGAELPPLESVQEEIRLILREAEVNRRVEDWIADLRRRADLVVYLW